jgi:UDP-N-acetylmuramate dehydrogenase
MTRPIILEQVSLAGHTTLGLGGPARFFAECACDDDIRGGIAFAREKGLPVFVLGGGSNVVVADEGFSGVVLHQTSSGIEFNPHGDRCSVRVAGGEIWDRVVESCVQRGLGGLECLSGIPGTAGATPIQNVGAYGQEVADTITAVHAIDLKTLDAVKFTARECGFKYRWSRFKGPDTGRYILNSVEMELPVTSVAMIRYPELARSIEQAVQPGSGKKHVATLLQARETVLRLRAAKGMVLDPADPDSRSVGSFFTNPVLDGAAFAALQARWRSAGNASAIPSFAAGEGVKVPAAWLVEHAGFTKGLRRGGVGVSSRHALALVNHNGSTRELLALAEEIRAGVLSAFGVKLVMEPVIVP